MNSNLSESLEDILDQAKQLLKEGHRVVISPFSDPSASEETADSNWEITWSDRKFKK